MRKIYLMRVLACALLILLCFKGIAQNKPSFSIPFTLIDNRPYIVVKVNQHTFHFILDCGADYVLNLNTAKLLNLELENKSMQGGAGAKEVPHWTTFVNDTQIGPVAIHKTTFQVTDFSEIKNNLHLPYLDGIIGYSFMKNFAVQFDYPKNVINFYSVYSGVSPVPFTMLYGMIPQFNVQIDGISALFIADTGDRAAFTVFNHFAIKNGIIKNYQLSDTTITGYGVGGPIYARTLTIKNLSVGKMELRNIPSRIPMLTSGLFTDAANDGSIGGGILKQYKFTIDYKKQKLYFE